MAPVQPYETRTGRFCSGSSLAEDLCHNPQGSPLCHRNAALALASQNGGHVMQYYSSCAYVFALALLLLKDQWGKGCWYTMVH